MDKNTKLHFKIFGNEHYEMVLSWFQRRDPKFTSLAFISNYGIVFYSGDLPLCCGWVYLSNSPIAWVSWFVSNPDAPLSLRVNGLKSLVNQLRQEAITLGARAIWSSQKSKSLIKLFRQSGFRELETGASNLFYIWDSN